MRKYRWFVDADKEENWLNQMGENDWVCQRVNGFGLYEFTKQPGADQVIRLDFQTISSKESYEEYVQLHKDFGWAHIGGTRKSSVHHWRKKRTGEDVLFSDTVSQQAYYKRLSLYYGSFALFFFVLTISLFDSFTEYASIQEAYFTPGLWEKQGLSFLLSFLFETPFALGRYGAPWLILFFFILFAFAYMRSEKKKKSVEA